MGDYILGTEERRRLEMLEECLDPVTTRSLDAIGVEPGWSCLEVGGGGGSVTRMLCERVGLSGLVTAIDLDTRFLDELGFDQLAVEQRNVVADGLPGGGYDLIHTRMLLIHLPNREKVIEEMVAALRPGGWLLCEELDIFPITAVSEGPYAEFWEYVAKAFDLGAMATEWGRQLPGLFDRAGLTGVHPHCEVAVYQGGSVWADVSTATIAQMRPFVLAAGATDEQIEDFNRLLADRTQWFHHFAIYSVRGQAPAG